METNTQQPAQPLHPEVEKILEFVIPNRKIRPDLRPTDGEGIALGDLIEPSDIRFDQRTRKPMMLHGGVLAICDGIGVEFLTPTIEKTGEKEYQATVGIRLGDGSVFYATGEASSLNVDARELSGKYPVNQTHIRALNKAVVRALGLYRVLLTEEEADEFKLPQVVKLQQEFEAKLKDVMEKAKTKEERLLKMIGGIMQFVALPKTDSKYPTTHLSEIMKEDKAYLEEIANGENKIIGFVATQLMKEQQKQEEEALAQALQTAESIEPTVVTKTEEVNEPSIEESIDQQPPVPTPTQQDTQKNVEDNQPKTEGEILLQQALTQSAKETSATTLDQGSIQLIIDEAGNVVEPK